MQFGSDLTLVDLLVYPLIGTLIGFLFQIGLRWFSNQQSKMKLRRALIAELEEIEEILNTNPSSALTTDQIIANIPRIVFDSNTGRIGELSDKEIEVTTRFYLGITEYELKSEELLNKTNEIDQTGKMIEHLIDRGYISYEDIDLEDLLNKIEEAKGRRGSYLLGRLEQRRKNAIEEMSSNMEITTVGIILNGILPENPRGTGDWDKVPPSQRTMIAVIGYLFQFEPFTQEDLNNCVEEKDISKIFRGEKKIRTGSWMLKILLYKELIERVDEEGEEVKYKLTYKGSNLINGYLVHTEEINRDVADFGWVP